MKKRLITTLWFGMLTAGFILLTGFDTASEAIISNPGKMASHTKNVLIMDISFKSIILFGSVILTGLSAGLFYAWSVSVIPGTKGVMDLAYLETMQSINRAILNPAFFLVFFGSIVLLSISSIYEFHNNKWVFGLMLASSITYLIGTVGVTGLGNVPLNDQLEVLKIAEAGADKISEFRKYYESNWNRLHLIRTVFAVLSFVLAVLALFIQTKKF